MNVLLLSQCHPFVGGIETRSQNILKYMDHEFSVVSPLLPPHSKHPSKDFESNVLYLDYSNRGQFLRAVLDAVDMKEVAVIDVQCNVYLGLLGLMLSQLTKKPLISSFHMNLQHPDHAEEAFFAAHQDLITQLIYDSNEIVCVSESVKESLLDFSSAAEGKNPPIHVISNGVDLDTFHPQRNRGNNDEKESAILFVGRFSREKNIPFLLRLYSEIRKQHEYALWLVGDGPERRPAEQLVRDLNIKDSTIFWGNVYGEDLARLYRTASFTVSPSTTEAFGMTTLESVACGTPVLASDNPGTAELMHQLKGGVLFRLDDLEGACDAFQVLARGYDDYRTEGLKNVQKFAWPRVLSPLNELYATYTD
ncbi:MAG: glycosyltransferase family 4 protein [Theionarchaea archaeon]|nr:glycosyltransferase family 4 protein [Theionarchaea archaeon]MBU7034146.1 glycosyltransferase family 4 protein [Theionarchaea archaeon]